MQVENNTSSNTFHAVQPTVAQRVQAGSLTSSDSQDFNRGTSIGGRVSPDWMRDVPSQGSDLLRQADSQSHVINGGAENASQRTSRQTSDGKIVYVDPFEGDRNVSIARERTVATDGGASYVTKDRLVFTTGDGNDNIHVSSNADGSLAVDVNGVGYSVEMANGQALEIRAGAGDDVVLVDSDVKVNLVVDGGPGDDTITTGAGDDIVYGGDGNDTISTGAGNDYVDGGAGDDRIDGGSGNDVLYGGDGDDRIEGGAGNDYIDGGAGDDFLSGGAGNDILSGGLGNDVLDGGKGDDVVYTGAGVDTVNNTGGTDTIHAQVGVDKINDASAGAGPRTYVVRAGDTLSQIAASHDVSLRALADANPHIRDLNRIRVGQEISIPGAVGEEPAHNKIVNVDLTASLGTQGIRVEGSEGFVKRVQADLEMLRSSPTGQQMLAEFDAAAARGNTLTIRELQNEDNGFAMSAGGTLQTDGTPGPTSDVTIAYNPEFHMDAFPAPVGVLYHEMSHAYNGVNGTFQPGTYSGPDRLDSGQVPNAERQAVGLDNSGVPYDFDHDPTTPKTTANPAALTENGLRAELGLPLRLHYTL